MSWQLAAFSILAFALIAGFAWYERTRPDARIVALVATLAALAALGRIAFAAVPNVKPTTDIVLISGYTLGGAPGFAVGAIAGLTSNFFFGQGPWTPWQMAAWGLTGIIGAGLAVVTLRRIGRWPLAIVCGVVGFWFAAFQDFGDWVTFSDHSLVQLGIYVGKGLGFDLIHAVSCVLFALAFGTPMIRSIQRFTRRLEVRWEPAHGAAGATALLVALILSGWLAGQPGPIGAGTGSASAANTPAGYLLSIQNRDGGFGTSPGSASSPVYSGWAALGLAAAGHNPRDVSRSGTSLLAYIRATAGSATDPGSIERTILVAGAAGVSASSFGGQDLIGRLESDIRRERLGQRPGQPHLIRRPRAAGRWRDPVGANDRLAGPPAGPRRGVQLRHRRRCERCGRHGGRTRGARRRRRIGRARQAPRRGVHPTRAESGRRLSVAAGGRFERSIDGVGDPGAARRRCRPELGSPGRKPVAAALSELVDRRGRPYPLLAVE